MALNETQIAGIAYSLFVIPIAIAFVITIDHFKEDRSRHSLYFMLAWLSYCVWGLANGFNNIFYLEFFTFLSSISTIPLGFFTILFLDGITRDTIDPLKVAIVSALSAVKIILMIQPGAIFHIEMSDGSEVPQLNPILLVAGTILTLLLGVWYVYFMARIYLHAPRKVRSYARLGLGGALSMGLGAPIVALLEVYDNPQAVDIVPLFIGFGALLTAYAFYRQPQLAYILPFQAYRLTVIENEGGIPLFTHTWNPGKELIDSTLFSSMLQGISGILQESLQKGNVREIHLDEAIMLLQRDEKMPVTCVLVATKSTPSLREALKAFADQFYARFTQQLKDIHRSDTFTPAEELVAACFPFVPEYD